MADELIDIFDEDNNFLDVQKMKSQAHKNGLWHRTAHIWIYNSNGEILLQLRAKNKDIYPNVWDISAAGHIGAGEDIVISGLREVEEEISLKLKEKDLDFYKILKKQTSFKDFQDNEFHYVYISKFEGDISNLKKQEEEVQELKFIPISKLEEDLKLNPKNYTAHGDYWFEMINEIKNRLYKKFT